MQSHPLHDCQNELVLFWNITMHSVTIMPYLCIAFCMLHAGFFFFLRFVHSFHFLAVVGLSLHLAFSGCSVQASHCDVSSS